VHNRENKSLVIACNDQIVNIDQEKTGGLIILLNKERQIDPGDLKSKLLNSILGVRYQAFGAYFRDR
jgi:hypothetical protein